MKAGEENQSQKSKTVLMEKLVGVTFDFCRADASLYSIITPEESNSRKRHREKLDLLQSYDDLPRVTNSSPVQDNLWF